MQLRPIEFILGVKSKERKSQHILYLNESIVHSPAMMEWSRANARYVQLETTD